MSTVTQDVIAGEKPKHDGMVWKARGGDGHIRHVILSKHAVKQR